jgi:hypothetical protein
MDNLRLLTQLKQQNYADKICYQWLEEEARKLTKLEQTDNLWLLTQLKQQNHADKICYQQLEEKAKTLTKQVTISDCKRHNA